VQVHARNREDADEGSQAWQEARREVARGTRDGIEKQAGDCHEEQESNEDVQGADAAESYGERRVSEEEESSENAGSNDNTVDAETCDDFEADDEEGYWTDCWEDEVALELCEDTESDQDPDTPDVLLVRLGSCRW